MNDLVKKSKNRILALGIIFACMISSGIFMQSCNDETEVPALDIPEEYNEVGKLHNEGLEYVFTQIKAQALETVKNPDIKSLSAKINNQEFIKQVTIDFCEKNKRLKGGFAVYEQAIEKVLNPEMTLKSTTLENVNPSLETLQDAITAAIRKEYKKEELSQLKFQLDGINHKAAEILSEEEAIQVYCMTSTAYSSYQYWMDNYKKWYFALNYPEILEQYNDAQLNRMEFKSVNLRSIWSDLWNTVEDWWDTVSDAVGWWWDNGGSDIVIADAAGAGAGAVTGSITGPGTIPGAIAGGLAGSVKSAVEYYLVSVYKVMFFPFILFAVRIDIYQFHQKPEDSLKIHLFSPVFRYFSEISIHQGIVIPVFAGSSRCLLLKSRNYSRRHHPDIVGDGTP